MTIKIKDTEYNIKYTLRAIFIFEQITGKIFSIKNITDEYLYLYCLLLANNKDIDMTFDDLITYCDEDPYIMLDFQKSLNAELEKQKQFNKETGDSTKKKV